MLLLRISVIAPVVPEYSIGMLHFLYISNGTFVLFSAVVAPEFATWRNFIFFSTTKRCEFARLWNDVASNVVDITSVKAAAAPFACLSSTRYRYAVVAMSQQHQGLPA